VALVAVAAGVGLLMVLRGDEAADTAQPCIPGTPGCPGEAAAGPAEEALAFQYAPVLYLRQQRAPCDREGAGYEPIPVEAVLENPAIPLRRASDGSVVTGAPAAADLARQTEPTYLDFPGNPRRPNCLYERDAARFSDGLPNVAYARIARQEGYDGLLVLQYWFFYYFNDWNNKHEGDWEMIQLVFEAETAAEALETLPDRIAYSQHSGGELASWDDTKLEKEGFRPVVYVAAGSQANFYSAHIYLGRAEQGAGFGCDDASPPSRRLSVEARLVPPGAPDPDGEFAWLAYTGRWGQLAGREFDGPTGPNMKQQWDEPFTWEERLRYSSVRVPSRQTLGQNAVGAFCNFVGFTTDLFLPIILELPLLAGAAVLGGGVLLLFSLTQTRYLPIEARPLRKRRRIGQILLSSAEIYRRRAYTLLRFGLVYLPATVLFGALQWLLFDVGPAAPVVPIPEANPLQEAILWFALAEVQFGLAYAVVLALTTAAVGRLERDEPVTVRDSIRHVLGRMHFAVTRLAAAAVVGALAFTVIGIPLALRQAVRWVFIEQAALIDDHFAGGALRESSRIVGRDWWWAAGSVVALGAFGLFGPAAFGIFLLLAVTSLPVTLVNLVAALMYVALVPYVAIALTLVYFDLRSREEEATEGTQGT
jgi:hypothetical protein